MEGDAKGKTFGLKGHTLPGINQRSEGNTDLADGRSKSSTFQFSNTMMGALNAGNIAQNMPGQNANPNANPNANTGASPKTWNIGAAPTMSKPSMAKKYGTFSKYKTFKK